MKSMFRHIALLMAAFVLAGLPVIGQGADTNEAVHHAGIVTQIDTSRGAMTIDKQSYQLDPGAAVHDPFGKHVSLEMVHEGMKIRVLTVPARKAGVASEMVREIWITTD